MKIKFTVTKCTANKKGMHVITMIFNEQVIFFGQQKDVKRTVYLGGMPAAIAIGTVIEEDTSNFYIKEYPTAMCTDAAGVVTFMDVDVALKNGIDFEQLNLKWLHVRTTIEKNVKIEQAA